jgi:hypothetical protein
MILHQELKEKELNNKILCIRNVSSLHIDETYRTAINSICGALVKNTPFLYIGTLL